MNSVYQRPIPFLVQSECSGWESGREEGTEKHWMTQARIHGNELHQILMRKQWELKTSFKMTQAVPSREAFQYLTIFSPGKNSLSLLPKINPICQRGKQQPNNKTISYLLAVQVAFFCRALDQGQWWKALIYSTHQDLALFCLLSLLRGREVNPAHFHPWLSLCKSWEGETFRKDRRDCRKFWEIKMNEEQEKEWTA